MNIQEFWQMAEQGIVLLDGATGSNFRQAGMPVGVCGELWAMEHPQVVLDLQRAYVDAGSRILFAPTFSANRISLGLYGLEDRIVELNAGPVALTRQAAGGRAYVAGDITTTGKVLGPCGDMTYAQLMDVYKEQVRILADSGADLIVAETMLTLEETMAALEAAQSVCDLPVMCTMTLESDGRLMYGGTVTEAVEALQEMGAAAVGLNCSVGPDQLEAVVSSMKQVARVPVVAKPNAGMPVMDDRGVAHYSMTPDAFAAAMRKLIWRGARIVGGCCGTTPDYIRALAGVID